MPSTLCPSPACVAGHPSRCLGWFIHFTTPLNPLWLQPNAIGPCWLPPSPHTYPCSGLRLRGYTGLQSPFFPDYSALALAVDRLLPAVDCPYPNLGNCSAGLPEDYIALQVPAGPRQGAAGAFAASPACVAICGVWHELECRAGLQQEIITALLLSHSQQLTGSLVVTTPGTYALLLSSDDGSRLFLDDTLLIDNGGIVRGARRMRRWGEVAWVGGAAAGSYARRLA